MPEPLTMPSRSAGGAAVSRTQTDNAVLDCTRKLLAYCHSNEWSGYDPYDALNSPLLAVLPVLSRRLPRLVLTQILKRSPVNCRPLLGIPRTRNPKALALFLSALLRLNRIGLPEVEQAPDLIPELTAQILALCSPGHSYPCWGYSFPWQTRGELVAKGAPNLVCTVFVANALFDACESSGRSELLETAIGATHYLLEELYRTQGDRAGFAYPLPSSREPIHNANLLGAALLARAYPHTKDERFLEVAVRVARSSVACQHDDGSWFYGEAAAQRWIDNFHTGYNLCALRELARCVPAEGFEEALRRGFAFYRSRFLSSPDGSVPYFHDGRGPTDIHAVAQSIITLAELRDIEGENPSRARAIFAWANRHLWDERGYFYYQRYRSMTNRISYMRWSQAWMLLALSVLLEAASQSGKTNGREEASFAEFDTA